VILQVEITTIAFGGAGIAKLPTGKVCFVPGVAPGESVEIQIVREKKSYAEARLVRVIEASARRVEPPCPVFGQCGGCQYQHLAYDLQLAIKRDQVAEALSRIGGIPSPQVGETVPSPLEYSYRNRITVHTRNGRTGFFAKDSRHVVDVTSCPISSAALNSSLAALRATKPYDGEHPLREASEFRGFRQVNAGAADKLLEVVESLAQPGGKLLIDAYSGGGFFASRLHPLFEDVIGIEWSMDAVRHARESAPANAIYLRGSVASHLEAALAAAPAETTTVLVDPPAEGLEDEVLAMLVERAPGRLIYISCNPSTLARDASRFRSVFDLQRACPVDMFPQTAQIECAALFEKR